MPVIVAGTPEKSSLPWIVLTSNHEEILLIKNNEGEFILPRQSDLNDLGPVAPTLVGPEAVLCVLPQKISSKLCWQKLNELNGLGEEHGKLLCWALGSFWPEFAFLYGKTPASELKRVLFFGGSFNPWHLGHGACVELAPAGELIVVPDYNPDKNMPTHKCVFQFYKGLKKRFSAYESAEKKIQVFPGLLGSHRPSPTISWLPQVPIAEKGMLLGDDQFSNLHAWRESERLLQNLQFLVVTPRHLAGEKLQVLKAEYEKNHPHLKLIISPRHPYETLSSSAIRKGEH